jgi:hypothetical protein
MRVKTEELTGTALDWAVAKCEAPVGGYKGWVQSDLDKGILHGMAYSNDWLFSGPIIERERIYLQPEIGKEGAGNAWYAVSMYNTDAYGSTPLIAAMRCYVASKLGDEVEIPTEEIN